MVYREKIYKWWVFHIYVSLQDGKLLKESGGVTSQQILSLHFEWNCHVAWSSWPIHDHISATPMMGTNHWFLNVFNIFSHATTHSAVVHGATGWYLPSHQLRHAPTRRGGVWVAIAAARSIPNCPSWSGWSDASFRPGPGPWSLG